MADQLFPKVYELIKADKITATLELLMIEVPEKSNEWVLFQNRITTLEERNQLGTMSLEEYNPEKARIIYGLTNLLESVMSKKEPEEEKEAEGSAELVTTLVHDQISFLQLRIRELNFFQVGMGIFTSILFFVSAYYMYDNMAFFKQINLHIFSIILFALYLLIILVSLFLIHLTKDNLSDNKTKFSVYWQVFRKIKI